MRASRLGRRVVWCITPALALLCAGSLPAAAQTPARILLFDLGGGNTAYVGSLSGGQGVGRVSLEPVRADGVVPKHLGAALAYQPIVLEFQQTGVVLDRLIDALRSGTPLDFSLVFADANYTELHVRRVTQARVVAIAASITDPLSTGNCSFRVELDVTQSADSPGTGRKVGFPPARQQCSSGRFSLSVNGVVVPAVGIDSLVLRRTWTDPAGGSRDAGSDSRLDIPNLRITVPVRSDAVLSAWYDDFVLQGHNTNLNERTLSIQFLAPTLLPPALLTLTASGVGVVSAHQVFTTAGTGAFTTGYELYVEEWARQGQAVTSGLGAVGLPSASPPPPDPPAGLPVSTGGAFSLSLPSGVQRGRHAEFCSFAQTGTLLINFAEGDLLGAIIGEHVERGVRSHAVTVKGGGGVEIAMMRTEHGEAYPATAGTLTISSWTDALLVGTFRYTGSSNDADGVTREHAVTGSFKAVRGGSC